MLSSKSKQATARCEPINDMASISSRTYRYGSGDKIIDTQLRYFQLLLHFMQQAEKNRYQYVHLVLTDVCSQVYHLDIMHKSSTTSILSLLPLLVTSPVMVHTIFY